MKTSDFSSHRTAVSDVDTPNRKVMFVEGEPSISKVLDALLGGLSHDGQVVFRGEAALAKIARESFDAVLLDLRYSITTADRLSSGLKEIRPSLVGRVLVLTGEVADPAVLELVERYCGIHPPRHHLMKNVRHWLHNLRGPSRKLRPLGPRGA